MALFIDFFVICILIIRNPAVSATSRCQNRQHDGCLCAAVCVRSGSIPAWCDRCRDGHHGAFSRRCSRLCRGAIRQHDSDPINGGFSTRRGRCGCFFGIVRRVDPRCSYTRLGKRNFRCSRFNDWIVDFQWQHGRECQTGKQNAANATSTAGPPSPIVAQHWSSSLGRGAVSFYVPADIVGYVYVVQIVFAASFGVLFAVRIGGADMPVLISFLNATAGLAAALMRNGDRKPIADRFRCDGGGLRINPYPCYVQGYESQYP